MAGRHAGAARTGVGCNRFERNAGCRVSSMNLHAKTTTDRIRMLGAGLLLAIAASGCASTSKVMVGQARAPIPPEQVMVYFTPPPGEYEEIAILETASGPFTYGEQNKMDAVIEKLRTAAGELGANGVLFQGTASGYGGSSVGVGVGGGRIGGSSFSSGGVGVSISPSPKHARGVAIHVFDPPAPTPTPGEPPPAEPAAGDPPSPH